MAWRMRPEGYHFASPNRVPVPCSAAVEGCGGLVVICVSIASIVVL